MVPENRTAFEGDNVELNCRFISGAAAYVLWVRHYKINGSYVSSSGKTYEKVVQVSKSYLIWIDKRTLGQVRSCASSLGPMSQTRRI